MNKSNNAKNTPKGDLKNYKGSIPLIIERLI